MSSSISFTSSELSSSSGEPESFSPPLSLPHLGNLFLGCLFQSPVFSFQSLSRSSQFNISHPPSNSLCLSSYDLLSACLSNFDAVWILGGCLPVRASASSPSLTALSLNL